MFQSIAISEPDAYGTARIKAQLDTIRFNPKVELSVNSVKVVNMDDIVTARKRLLGSIYGLEIQAKNGLVIMNSVGPPFGGNCPVQMPAL
jgi:hypothetical protein